MKRPPIIVCPKEGEIQLSREQHEALKSAVQFYQDGHIDHLTLGIPVDVFVLVGDHYEKLGNPMVTKPFEPDPTEEERKKATIAKRYGKEFTA